MFKKIRFTSEATLDCFSKKTRFCQKIKMVVSFQPGEEKDYLMPVLRHYDQFGVHLHSFFPL